MDIDQVVGELKTNRLVPVVTIRNAQDAPQLGQALLGGGLPLAEITFRTNAAAGAIAGLRRFVPNVLVGAGTVLDKDTVDIAMSAGAQFIVAPGFNPAVVDHCLSRGIPIIPGVSTPTEIEMGLSRGLTLMKFFPAEAAGGLRMLSAMAAPYKGVRFMPTGGITLANLPEYLAHDSVLACGGTWLATADAIAGHRFQEIEDNVTAAVSVVSAAKGPTGLSGSPQRTTTSVQTIEK